MGTALLHFEKGNESFIIENPAYSFPLNKSSLRRNMIKKVRAIALKRVHICDQEQKSERYYKVVNGRFVEENK